MSNPQPTTTLVVYHYDRPSPPQDMEYGDGLVYVEPVQHPVVRIADSNVESRESAASRS